MDTQEYQWLGNLIATSPLAGVLGFMLKKVWEAYQSEVQYNKSRDMENLSALNSLSTTLSEISRNLAKASHDLDSSDERLSALQNSISNVSTAISDFKAEIRELSNKIHAK